MHADRANRIAISGIGLIALVLGIGGLLAAGGVFGTTFQHRQLVANGFSRYVGQHGTWLWPAIAAVTLIIVLLALLWMVRLLFATDRAGEIALGSSKWDASADRSGGRTTLAPAALVRAVTAEIESYHGVIAAKGRIIGEPTSPTLAVEVSASRSADLSRLLTRIEEQAIGHAREATAMPALPVKLDISVSDKDVSRIS